MNESWPTDSRFVQQECDETEQPLPEAFQRLQAVTDAALSSVSLEELQRNLLPLIRDLLSGDVAMLMLQTHDGGHLQLCCSSSVESGFEQYENRHILIPVGEGVAGRIAAARKPLTFPDLAQTQVINPVLQEKNVHSLVGAPLMMADQVVGVIYVGKSTVHHFPHEDERILQWMANRFALAFERAQLYEALRAEGQRKHAILEAALDCIIMMDGEGLILEFNPAAEQTFGYRREEVIGQPLAECIIPPALRQKHHEGLAKYLSTRQGPVLNKRIEIIGMKSDGTEFPVELTIVPLHLAHEVVFTGYIRDITERKENEAQREYLLTQEQEARAVAESANRAKDEFLAIVSHELRTPLTPIIGWTSLLQSNPQQFSSPESLQQAVGVIERNARSQAQLISDLLDVSRIVTGKLSLDVRSIELHPVIEAALETVQPAADAKGIKLRTFLDHNAGIIKGDSDRLQQVAWNLLSNSIKFTPKGGRVEVILERVDSSVELTVRDNGEGIDPEFLPHIFDRFLQADTSNTRQHGGLGLGLSIVRHLVDLHGGEVTAESAGLGRGVSFRVRLPLLAMVHETTPMGQPITDDETTPINADVSFIHEANHGTPRNLLDGLRVLVVEDEADARDLIVTVLQGYGAQAEAASSVEEGFQKLKQWRPDILVSDIGMPHEDGYSLMRRVRALSLWEGGKTPAIALTAYARMEDRFKALSCGFQNHVVKPVEPAELAITIASILGRAVT